ncbi:hypothetical protein UlMin_022262 [Ulmus minor]
MMLRNSISSTRKFFQKTLGSLKSFFSGGSYEKLPKSPLINNATPFPNPINNVQPSSKELDKFYANQWDYSSNQNEDCKKTSCRRRITSLSNKQDQDEVHQPAKSPSKKKNNYAIERRSEAYYNRKTTKVKRLEDQNCSGKELKREQGKKYCLVEEKLKELEMLDKSNVDHVLDIEEILHYYSRLTCPAYVDIVDNFFVEMFVEFFGPSTPVHSVNTKFRRRRD